MACSVSRARRGEGGGGGAVTGGTSPSRVCRCARYRYRFTVIDTSLHLTISLFLEEMQQ